MRRKSGCILLTVHAVRFSSNGLLGRRFRWRRVLASSATMRNSVLSFRWCFAVRHASSCTSRVPTSGEWNLMERLPAYVRRRSLGERPCRRHFLGRYMRCCSSSCTLLPSRASENLPTCLFPTCHLQFSSCSTHPPIRSIQPLSQPLSTFHRGSCPTLLQGEGYHFHEIISDLLA